MPAHHPCVATRTDNVTDTGNSVNDASQSAPTQEENQIVCSICLDPLICISGSDPDEEGEGTGTDAPPIERVAALFDKLDCRIRACSHFFHAACIKQVRRKQCPLCRKGFASVRSVTPTLLATQTFPTIVHLLLKLARASGSCDVCARKVRACAVDTHDIHV